MAAAVSHLSPHPGTYSERGHSLNVVEPDGCTTKTYKYLMEKSVYLFDKGSTLYNSSEAADGSIWENIGARLCFLVQTVKTIVFLPLNLIAMIFFPAIALFTEGPSKAWELLKHGAFAEYTHYAILPMMFVRTIAPHYMV